MLILTTADCCRSWSKEGFKGCILATRGTIDLCSYMLPDAGSIQESEVAALNRRNAARRRPAVSPIYTQADAIASLQSFRPVEYETWTDVIPGVRARYWNAGHLLGSASIELEFAGEGAPASHCDYSHRAISVPTRNCSNLIRRPRPASTT